MLQLSGAGTATSATGQSDGSDMKADVRKQTRSGTMKDKATRTGTFGGYEVTGWRYANDASWHVKVWRAGHPHEWMGYSMTAGVFELEAGDQAHKQAVLHAISEWEVE
jgi:hypothetical protein